MVLIRRVEERGAELYQAGKIGGFMHLYIGQEAVSTGLIAAREPRDRVITAYRDHGVALNCGIPAESVMAELLGKATGMSKGKGGSMHMFSIEKAFYGGHGIVGAQVSLGTGLAFANKYRKDGKVCLTYFGDGAANQGQVYESFNMAALWKLPVVYIVENNQYAMGTSIQRSTSETHLHKRGVSFNIPGEEVDGMDVVAVREAGKRAVERARAGEGPMLLEMKTYRYRGHSMSDPAKYRTKEEVDEQKSKRDPIEHVKKLLIDAGHATEDELKTIDREIRTIVTDSATFAQESPEPDPSELMTDIYL
jgi:pyruvate dehydrogenase E1 component alpha subunit